MNATHRTPHRAARGSSTTTLLIALVVASLGAAGVWLGLGQQAPPAIDATRLVDVARTDVLDAVAASGRVEPKARVFVMSRASGILKDIYVDAGDRVEKDQVIAELDREQLQAQLDQDEADLMSAEARLQAARARRAEAEVRVRDPELDFATREAARLEALYETGDVSERERDTAVNALEIVKQRIRLVEANLPVLDAAILEAQANLASAEAAAERSRTALREATVRSPITGLVLDRLKEVGDGVSSILTAGGNATQILSLGEVSEVYIESRVDEVDLGRIHEGMRAIVTVDAFRDRPLEGVVDRIAPAGSVDDNGIVTFEVRLTVDDPDALLRPDMTADARLVLESRDAVLTLPQRTLAQQPEGAWTVERVVSLEPPVTEVVEVELGLSDGLITEIVAGLDEGDRVLLPAVGPPGRR